MRPPSHRLSRGEREPEALAWGSLAASRQPESAPRPAQDQGAGGCVLASTWNPWRCSPPEVSSSREPCKALVRRERGTQGIKSKGTYSLIAMYLLIYKGRRVPSLWHGDPFLFRSDSRLRRGRPGPNGRPSRGGALGEASGAEASGAGAPGRVFWPTEEGSSVGASPSAATTKPSPRASGSTTYGA